MAKTTKTGVLATPTAKATTVLEDSSPVLPLPNTPQGVMAVGPRVTLHFVQDYNQAISYDYYDVVNVDGASYIAIQNVPANTPITNTDYWAKWNDPNAQFAQLQTTVEQYDERITSNNNAITNLTNEKANRKHMIVIGDSFGDPDRDDIGTPWCNHVASALDLELHNYSTSGAGFINTVDGVNLITEMTNAINEANTGGYTDDVAYVFVYGGVNDISRNLATPSNLASTANNSILQLFNAFNNAVIVIACPNMGLNWYDWDVQLFYYYMQYYNLQRCAIVVPSHTWGIFADPMFNSDNLHPNQNGSRYIASMMLAAIGGGQSPAKWNSTDFITAPDNITINYQNSIVSGNRINVRMSYTVNSYSDRTNNFTFSDYITVAKNTENFLYTNFIAITSTGDIAVEYGYMNANGKSVNITCDESDVGKTFWAIFDLPIA